MRPRFIVLALISLLSFALPQQASAEAAYNIRDCSISSLSGSSQSLAVANPNRKYLGIFNGGANTVYVNVAGGTAASTSISSIAMPPNYSLIFSPDNNRSVSNNAITIIGTAGQPVTCFEGR